MNLSECLTLLALIMALSAYVGLVFAFAAVVMAVFHACEWCKSVSWLRELRTKQYPGHFSS